MNSKDKQQQLQLCLLSLNLSVKRMTMYTYVVVYIVCPALLPFVIVFSQTKNPNASVSNAFSIIFSQTQHPKTIVISREEEEAVFMVWHLFVVFFTALIMITVFELLSISHFTYFQEKGDLKNIVRICENNSEITCQRDVIRWQSVFFYFMNFIPYLAALFVNISFYQSPLNHPRSMIVIIIPTVFGIWQTYCMSSLMITGDANSLKLINKLREMKLQQLGISFSVAIKDSDFLTIPIFMGIAK